MGGILRLLKLANTRLLLGFKKHPPYSSIADFQLLHRPCRSIVLGNISFKFPSSSSLFAGLIGRHGTLLQKLSLRFLRIAHPLLSSVSIHYATAKFHITRAPKKPQNIFSTARSGGNVLTSTAHPRISEWFLLEAPWLTGPSHQMNMNILITHCTLIALARECSWLTE